MTVQPGPTLLVALRVAILCCAARQSGESRRFPDRGTLMIKCFRSTQHARQSTSASCWRLPAMTSRNGRDTRPMLHRRRVRERVRRGRPLVCPHRGRVWRSGVLRGVAPVPRNRGRGRLWRSTFPPVPESVSHRRLTSEAASLCLLPAEAPSLQVYLEEADRRFLLAHLPFKERSGRESHARGRPDAALGRFPMR